MAVCVDYLDNATLTITVRLTRKFRFRLWAGFQLLKLVALVLPVNTVLIDEDEEWQPQS